MCVRLCVKGGGEDSFTDPPSSAHALTSWIVFLSQCVLDARQGKINGINLRRQWCELRQSAGH